MKKNPTPYERPFMYPCMEGWAEQEKRMFPVMMNHLLIWPD